MQIIAHNDTYCITSDKRGEGTYGAVYVGHLKNDPTTQLAFKQLKQPDKLSGLIQHTNIREATFLSEMRDMLTLQENPFVPLIDIVLGDLLTTQNEELKQSLIIVMPLYQLELSKLLDSNMIQDFDLKHLLLIVMKLFSLVAKMHQLNFAHRDLKHNNIMAMQNWKFSIIDFGMVQYNPDVLIQQTYENEEVSNLNNEQNTFDLRSSTITALSWRPPEQYFSKAQLQEPHNVSILKQLNNGFKSDSYVLGIMILEFLLGLLVYRPKQPEDEGGLAEVIAMHFYISEYCQENKHLIKNSVNKTQILEHLNQLNSSQFQSFDNAVSWCRISYHKLILKSLLIRFYKELNEENVNVIKKLADLIVDLTQFDCLQRLEVDQLIKKYPEFYINDETEANLQLEKDCGQLGNPPKKTKMTMIQNFEELGGKLKGFVFKCVEGLESEEIKKWM
uniref:Kinase, CMGC n=1 Tax=Trepomonas sp. PC1 TaxID=1076344 RepID=A0A146K7C0_9EUKA|eukprot:JAP91451.1 Kinase, CMGC [Trepomonas sp. PC1]